MPIIDLSCAQAQTHRGQSNCGVIVYRVDPGTGDIEGVFALALYEGQLAREVGRKLEGTPGDFGGAYQVTTFAPDGTTFAEGTMTALPMGGEGVYGVTWVLQPVEPALQSMGYVPGTTLLYRAIGLKLPGSHHVSVAWDNNLFLRSWPGASGKSQWTYAVTGDIGPQISPVE